MDERSLVTAWLAGYTSSNTRAAYERDVAVFRAWLAPTGRTLLEATGPDLSIYATTLNASPISPATARRRIAALAALYRFAQSSAAHPVNPAAGVARDRTPTRPTPHLEPHARDTVWRAAEAIGPRSAALVGLLMFDGLRLDDALALDVIHVRRSRTAVSVVRPPRPAVALDPRTAAAVLASRRGRTAGPLLVGDAPGRRGARLSRYGAHFVIRQLGNHAGLDAGLTTNHLRATYRADGEGSRR